MRVGRQRLRFTRVLSSGPSGRDWLARSVVTLLLLAGHAIADSAKTPAARVRTERSAPGGYTLWLHTAPEAADCPAALELRRRISERLGQDPFADGAQPGAAMHISFTRIGQTYRARLALNGADGAPLERHFEDRAQDCQHLADALVLGGTLLLEGASASAEQPIPNAVSEPAKPNAVAVSSASIGLTDPPAQPVKGAERTATVSAANTTRVPSELSLGPTLSYGVVSDKDVAWGMRVAGALYPFGAWGVKLGAEYSIADTIRRGVTQYQFSQTSVFVSAVVSGRLHPRLHVVPELGLMVGALHAAVLTHDPIDPGDFFFAGMRAGGTLQWRCLGPWTLGAGGHLRLPFNRHIFRASGLSEPVWQQPLLGFSAEVVLGLHFD